MKKTTRLKPFFLELLASIVVCMIMFGFLLHYKGKSERFQEALGSTNLEWTERINSTRNRLNQQVAEVTAVSSMTRQELQTLQAAHGSTMERLQKEVRRNTQLAAVIRQQTTSTVVMTTDTVYLRDNDSTPVYQGSVSDEWADIEVTATADTIMVDYLVRNEFVFQAVTKGWVFKPRTIEATVTSLNPHTETVGLSTWLVPVKKPRRLAWLATGVGLGLLLPVLVGN
jgi:hypothetical protein